MHALNDIFPKPLGTDGIALATWANGRAWALAIQPDGKIVAGGYNSANWLLARFTDAGALDTNFSSDGKQTVSLRSNSQLFNLRLAADGAIVGAGLTSGSNGWDMAVARLTPAGDLDTTFNGTGKVMTDVSGYEVVYGLVIGPDYHITVAGRTGSTIFQRDLVIARYTVASGLEERLYAQTDANHNVTGVADVFADPKLHIVYGPYGQAITLDKNWDTALNSLGWVIGSQGGRQDAVTHTIDRRNRVYNVPLGRFLQVDPIGNPDGVNRYLLEVASPVGHVDPSGFAAMVIQNLTDALPRTSIADSAGSRLVETIVNPPRPSFHDPAAAEGYLRLAAQLVDTTMKIRELEAQIANMITGYDTLWGCSSNEATEARDQIAAWNEKFGAIQGVIDTATVVRQELYNARMGLPFAKNGSPSYRNFNPGSLIRPQSPLEGIQWGKPIDLKPNLKTAWGLAGVVSYAISMRGEIKNYHDADANGDDEGMRLAQLNMIANTIGLIVPAVGLANTANSMIIAGYGTHCDVAAERHGANLRTISEGQFKEKLARLTNELRAHMRQAEDLTNRMDAIGAEDFYSTYWPGTRQRRP